MMRHKPRQGINCQGHSRSIAQCMCCAHHTPPPLLCFSMHGYVHASMPPADDTCDGGNWSRIAVILHGGRVMNDRVRYTLSCAPSSGRKRRVGD